MTPALYRPLFPRKGERKERLYASKHQKLSSSSRLFVVVQKEKKKEREREDHPFSRCNPNFWGSPFWLLFGSVLFFCLGPSFFVFCVCSFFSSLSLFLCGVACVETELDASRPLDSLSSCHQLASPPPFIYINVGIIF